MSVLAQQNGDETQALLLESIERYTREHYDAEHRRAALAGACGYSRQAWADYGVLGWLALRLPESLGGLDADFGASGLLMETVGARLLLEPLLVSAILGTGLLLRRASPEQRNELLPRLADGTLKVAVAHEESLLPSGERAVACEYRGGALYGHKLASLHADCADMLIVSARDASSRETASLYLLPATSTGLSRTCFRLLDGRGAANLRFDAAPAEPLGRPDEGAADILTLRAMIEETNVALCCEALGAIHALNQLTIQYLQERKQFGRPIGSNQALQHRMVEMYMLEQEVRAMTLAALRALSEDRSDKENVIDGARTIARAAARKIAAEAVQMHGGMGVSDEHVVSHYYRRLMVVNALLGERASHLAGWSRDLNDRGSTRWKTFAHSAAS